MDLGVNGIANIIISIRDATEEDLPEVVDLWGMLAKHHESLSDNFALAWDSKRRWAEYLERRFAEISTKLIVAEEKGRLVGFMLCFLSPNTPIFKERKIGVISDVYVQEERRRKGVANKMLDVGLRWFKKNKVRFVQLSVAHDNLEARAVWRSLGFEPYMLYKRLDLERMESRPKPALSRRIVKNRRSKKRRGFSLRKIRRGSS